MMHADVDIHTGEGREVSQMQPKGEG